ncbi:MAG: glycerol-3-phosphate 1-O-acyltransferase PlsY [Candidatus Omnitrophica bacterium]|jgi:glycerol-3-phosphate acyltransferase PlsY|nr:glycerol-3-phosphate 1-O-acyltransferase PlsY [Candidatus Omnitrophota bacterium]MCF7877802.1 glycerol-3-phosphate 1-O-acyltransferase PlsY [Candidatus Omnitrophota bacterium]MCF7891547.1 glycerol-3-phosphate 1-O-acyltransferase PlsY [Candidatus Omnitrophota bacterium]MCF7897341.1 glycerol-3-phosphate 1-O-acyltransferase PlsY [Candidatus Omnitrophota bacterium]MCF7909689.1 glycerol-3-phosphate 1-O-acyltransferase PlsY [Candidatus Omnitrophota bacterium]
MLKSILLLASFFLGSIPFGYIAARKIKHIDIRSYGSGNIGATNVFRVVGKKWGIFVFFFDFLKGFIVPFLVYFFGHFESYFLIILGAAAIAGHNWPPFLKFKGGKGVATSLGVLAALCFSFVSLKIILLISLITWLIIFLLTRIVSLASILASFSFVIFSFILSQATELKVLGVLLFLFIVIRHKKNIKMILKGKENKF